MPRTPQDRQQQVLEALVQLFIERREPISSRMIEESADLEIKSASIRAVLQDLERKGYLAQPHSSSGRVPTDDGYRAYVDALALESDVDDQVIAEVRSAVHEAGADLSQVLRAIARVLGRLSRNIAILAGPRERSPQIVGVDLYQRDSSHVFVVIELEGGAARTEMVKLDRSVVPESVVAATTVLGARMAGRELDMVRRDLEELVSHGENEEDQLARDVALGARSLFDPGGLLRVTYEGVSEALQQPEFADPSRLKALLELMSRSDEFEHALEDFVPLDRHGEVSVAIGRENPLPALHPFSLMATRFDLHDQYGYLAILGPRRMHYAHTVSLVRLIARHLDRIEL